MNRRSLFGSLAASALFAPMRAIALSRQRQVLAFYYGWYGTATKSGKDVHWEGIDLAGKTIANTTDYPQGGPYDSLDPAVVDAQVRTARAAGITGLIASWWGEQDRTNQQLTLLLPIAAKQGLKVTAYIEDARTANDLAQQILYIHQHHARHPAWLRLRGKQVVFLFDRVLQTIGLDGWKAARQQVEKAAPNAIMFAGTANDLNEIVLRKLLFDVLHIYSMQFEAAEKRLYPPLWRDAYYHNWVRAQAGLKATTATVLPGFDDTKAGGRDGKRPIVERGDGSLYQRLWRSAIRAQPDWILVVSWNEWHEGSQLEPSSQFGDRDLKTTRAMSAIFRGG